MPEQLAGCDSQLWVLMETPGREGERKEREGEGGEEEEEGEGEEGGEGGEEGVRWRSIVKRT